MVPVVRPCDATPAAVVPRPVDPAGASRDPLGEEDPMSRKLFLGSPGFVGFDCRSEHVKEVAEASLKRLRFDAIDLRWP
jgi:aryl-alcohol dehydrogenase-like predicted oxidoreductase